MRVIDTLVVTWLLGKRMKHETHDSRIDRILLNLGHMTARLPAFVAQWRNKDAPVDEALLEHHAGEIEWLIGAAVEVRKHAALTDEQYAAFNKLFARLREDDLVKCLHVVGVSPPPEIP